MRVRLNQNSKNVEHKTKIGEIKDVKMLRRVTFSHKATGTFISLKPVLF